MVVSILLQLRKISSLLNQKEIALNYLKSALGVAKSGDVPIEYILRIHYNLGKTYYLLKEHDNSLNHFIILKNFLENQEVSIENKNEFLGMTYLWVGMLYSEKNNINESKKHLKKTLQFANDQNLKVKLKLSLFRSRYYKAIGNLSQFQKLLKIGLDAAGTDFEQVDAKFHNTLIDLILELAEFYIHFRKDSKKAIYLLEAIKEYLNIKEIPGMYRTIRWNLLMADFHKFLINNPEKYRYFLSQSRSLKQKLQSFGIRE